MSDKPVEITLATGTRIGDFDRICNIIDLAGDEDAKVVAFVRDPADHQWYIVADNGRLDEGDMPGVYSLASDDIMTVMLDAILADSTKPGTEPSVDFTPAGVSPLGLGEVGFVRSPAKEQKEDDTP